jgi:GMP synthase-like glutamine amidotransferase
MTALVESADLNDDAIVPRKRALVIALDEQHPSGALLDALLTGGVQPVVVQVTRANDLPDPALVPAAIMVGSNRPNDAGFRDAEAQIDWLHKADKCGTSVMAVGRGARLLAVAFGGRVMPAERPLTGWAMVDTSLPHLIPGGPWPSWQHDLIWLSSHAQVLAHNRLGPQVFRLGRHLGVQFHPDATPQTAPECIARTAGPRGLCNGFARDPTAAAESARRLFATFLDGILASGWPADEETQLDRGQPRGRTR